MPDSIKTFGVCIAPRASTTSNPALMRWTWPSWAISTPVTRVSIQDQLRHQCAREHGQVRAIEEGKDIRPEDGETFTIAYAQIDNGSPALAFHQRTVVAVKVRAFQPSAPLPPWLGRSDSGRVPTGQTPAHPRRAVQGPAGPASPQSGDKFRVPTRTVPIRVAGLRREEIPIVPMSTRPRQDIDARILRRAPCPC